MTEVSASVIINAPVETIWHYLTDAASYTRWDPNINRVQGTIAVGNTLRFWTKPMPDRVFSTRVVEIVPNHRMMWKSNLPFGLFSSLRIFSLLPLDAGGVEFTTKVTFSGPLQPLILRTLPDMDDVFHQFVEGLKAVVEGDAG